MKQQKIKYYFFALLLLVVTLTACVTTTDPQTLQNLQMLQNYHLHFIADHSAANGKQWQLSEVEYACRQGKEKFNQVMQYEIDKSRRDTSRETAIRLLQQQFIADCQLLKIRAHKGHYFYTQELAKQLRQLVNRHYQLALEGELSRASM